MKLNAMEENCLCLSGYSFYFLVGEGGRLGIGVVERPFETIDSSLVYIKPSPRERKIRDI